MKSKLSIMDWIFLALYFFIVIIGIGKIDERIITIEKQLQQVTVMEKSRYMVSISPEDNWIRVILDPNDFEIKER